MRIIMLLLLVSLVGCSVNNGLSVVQGRLLKFGRSCNGDVVDVTLDHGLDLPLTYIHFKGASILELEELVGKEVKFKYEDIRKFPSMCLEQARLWYAKEVL